MKLKKKFLSYILIVAVLFTTVGSGINVSRAAEDVSFTDSYEEDGNYTRINDSTLSQEDVYNYLGKLPDGTQGTVSVSKMYSSEKIICIKNVLSSDMDEASFFRLVLNVGNVSSESFCGQIGVHVNNGDVYEKTSNVSFNNEWTRTVIMSALKKYKAASIRGDEVTKKVWYAAAQLAIWRALYLDSVGWEGKDFYSGEFKGLVSQVRDSINYNEASDLESCVLSIYSGANSDFTGISLYKWVNKTRNGQDLYSINFNTDTQHSYGRVELFKASSNATGESLAGAVYGVFTDAGCSSEVGRMTTNADGYAISDNLRADMGSDFYKYYVKELTAPSGFLVNPTVYGPVLFTEPDQIINVAGAAQKVFDEPIKIRLKLHKYDSKTKEPLSGVAFTLYERTADGSFRDMGRTLTETSAGVYESGDLVYTTENGGTFKVVETAVADKKYVKADYSKIFSIDVNGNAVQDIEEEVLNTPKMGRIDLYKSNEHNTKEKIGNCVFGIFADKDLKTKVEEMTTDDKGYAVSPYLAANTTYYVKEISAPAGFDVNNTVYSAKITPVSGDSWDCGIVHLNNKKDIPNKPWYGYVSLRKLNALNTSEKLSGAEFEVYEWNSSKKAYSDKPVQTIIEDVAKDASAETGVYTSSKLYYSVSNQGKFKIVETKAPAGFKMAYTQEFKIAEKTVTKGELSVANKDTLHLDAYNTPKGGYIEINKLGRHTGEPINGIVFGIFEDSNCKTQIGTMTTNKKGYAKYKEALPVGTYYVKELEKENKKVVGYTIPSVPKVYSVCVSQGKTSVVGENITINGEIKSCIPNDEWYGYVEVEKYDKNSKAKLSGATFSIYEWNKNMKKYSKTVLTSFVTEGAQGTGKSGALYYTDINEGKFKIVETGWPDEDYKNHEQGDPFTEEFKIVSPEDKSGKGKIPSTQTYTIKVPNSKTGAKIALYKCGDKSLKPIPNVEFGIYKKYADGKLSGKVEVIKTNENGYAISSDLAINKTYYIQEIEPKSDSPYGYNDYVYTVKLETNDNNTIKYVGEYENDYAQIINTDINNDGSKEPCIPNTETAVQLNVYKTGKLGSNSYLTGAEFTIYEWSSTLNDYDMNNGVKLNEVDAGSGEYVYGHYGDDYQLADQYLVYTSENKGKYLLKETAAPKGFINSDFSVELDVQKLIDEEMKTDEKKNYSVEYDQELGVQKVLLTVENQPILGSLTASKLDSDTKESEGQGDAVLSGAVYNLYADGDIMDPYEPDKVLYKNGDLVDTAKTDENGKFRIDNIPVAKYYLAEDTASSGYRIDMNTETSSVTKYEVDLVSVFNNLVEQGNMNDSVISHVDYETTVLENVQKNHFSIHKLGHIGSKVVNLEGAGFKAYLISTLTKDEKTGEYDLDNATPVVISSDENHPTELFTDAEGNAESINIPYGKYLVVETTVPEGFVAAEPQEIMISDNSKPEELALEYIDMSKHAAIRIIKKDAVTGRTIMQSGVKFKLLDENGETVKFESKDKEGNTITLEEFSTNEKGVATIPDLDMGTYTVVEVSAPSGYALAVEGKTVVLDLDSEYLVDEDTGDNVLQVEFEDQPNQVYIKKTDITTSEEVIGAHLQVIDASGDVYDSWVSDGTEHLITGIPAGDYTLIETLAPDEQGYVKSSDIKFTVKGDSVVQTVEMKDDYTKIDISKLDFTDGVSEIPGATLSVYRVSTDIEGNAIQNENGEYVKGTLVKSFETNGQPTRIEYLKPGLYILQEDSAPLGFTVSESVLFRVEATGEVQKVVMYDKVKTGTVSVSKFNAEDLTMTLEGAEFTVTDDKGNDVGKIITDSEGKGKLEGLPVAYTINGGIESYVEYTVTETKAPAGYEINAKPQTFTFKGTEENTIKDIVSLEFNDTPKKGSVHIIKTEQGNKDVMLEGAEFTITDAYNNLIGVISTDKSGEGTLDDLLVYDIYGNSDNYMEYTVTETKAPHGYAITEKPQTFTFEGKDNSDKIEIVSLSFEDEKIESPVGEITVDKTEKGNGQIHLEGAEFTVTDSEGNNVGKIITDSEGKGSLDNLKVAIMNDTENTIKEYIEYTITETKAPHGYAISTEPVTFTFEGTDGPLEVVNYTFEDEKIESPVGDITVDKVDADNNKLHLEGAEFTVTDSKGNVMGTIVTDQYGKGELRNLPVGVMNDTENTIKEYIEYTITETKAPHGYEITEKPKTFNFKNTDGSALSLVELAFKDRGKKVPSGSVSVTKIDAANKELHLKGAEFTVTDSKGNVAGVIVTDSDGNGELTDLSVGKLDADRNIVEYTTYTITETKAPEGYSITAAPQKFTFENAKKKNELVKLTFEDEKTIETKGKIGFVKTGDMLGEASKEETDYGKMYKFKFTNKSLAGVTFTIYKDKKCTEEVGTVVTTDKEVTYSEELELGTYYVKETSAPDGYVPDAEVHKVEINDSDSTEEIIAVSYECINHLGKTRIKVLKQGEKLDANNGKFNLNKRVNLEGVVFGVYTGEDIHDANDKVVVKKDSLVGTLKTDKDGKASFKDVLPEGKYYCLELETLDGFELDSKKYEFEVKYDGNNAVTDIDINDGEAIVNRLSTPTDVKLVKRDTATGAVLDDVEFELYDAANELIGTYVTDTSGAIVVKGLPYGDYYFVETRAQQHYVLTKKAIKFTIDGKSKVELDVSAFNQRMVIPRLGFMDAHTVVVTVLIVVALAGLFAAAVLLVINKKRKESDE